MNTQNTEDALGLLGDELPRPPALLHHPSARVRPPGAQHWTAGLAASPASPAHEGCSTRDRQVSRSAVLRTENCTNLPETTRPEAAQTPDPGPELRVGGEFRFQKFVPRSVSPREEQTLNGLGDQKAQKPKRPSVSGEGKQGPPSTKRRPAAVHRRAPTRAGPGEPRPLTSSRSSGRPTGSAPAATAARPGERAEATQPVSSDRGIPPCVDSGSVV